MATRLGESQHKDILNKQHKSILLKQINYIVFILKDKLESFIKNKNFKKICNSWTCRIAISFLFFDIF